MIDNLRIREMQIDDLEQVVPIENANFSVPWSENGFFSYLLRMDALFLVAEIEGTIVGYCGVLLIGEEGDITNVSIMPKMQGKGIGRALVQALIQKTTKEGVTTLHLEVRPSNQVAIKLYEDAGFKQVGLRKNYYEEPREDAILMTRRALAQ